MAPAFSAIIPSRDRPRLLESSLRKLLGCWDDRIAEVIVIDDGSSPDNVPRVNDLGRKVRWLRRGQSAGPAACRNQAAAEAAAELLLFFDDDSWPDAGDLSSLQSAFESDPRLAAVGFQVRVGRQCESGGAFNALVACGASVRRSPFLAAGGFPEEYRFYVEEYALCYRLIQRGGKVRIWESPIVQHEKADAGRDPRRILGQLVLNNRRLFEPHAQRIPAAADRLEEILDWYALLGRRLNVEEEVAQARAVELDLSLDPPCSPDLWERWSGASLLADFAARLREAGIRAVSLWPIGKDCRTFSRALGEAGVDVVDVLDPEGRFGIERFADLPVAREVRANGPAIVVASFSPGQCWNGLRGPVLADAAAVAAGFCFVGAGDPEDLEVRRRLRRRGSMERL